MRLDGHFEGDLVVEGFALDRVSASTEVLLAELFPTGAYETLTDYERVYGLAPGQDDPLQLRRNRIIQKIRERGRLDQEYFVELGAAMGFSIVIDELHPFMSGWGFAGDELGDEDSDWCWRVYYSEEGAYIFRAGDSAAGENLSYCFADLLVQAFNDLKPADTFVEFIAL